GSCRARRVVVHEVHCPAHGATVPWLAMRELLRSYLALAEGEGTEGIRRSVERQLVALHGGFQAAVPLVLEVLGVSGAPAPDDSARRVSARLADFMRRFVRLRSAKEPVLVLLDDAHWIDPVSDELVREIVTAVRDTRMLLLANYRPEYRPAWIRGSHCHQLALSPLGDAASRELLLDLLGTDDSLGDLANRIHERT